MTIFAGIAEFERDLIRERTNPRDQWFNSSDRRGYRRCKGKLGHRPAVINPNFGSVGERISCRKNSKFAKCVRAVRLPPKGDSQNFIAKGSAFARIFATPPRRWNDFVIIANHIGNGLSSSPHKFRGQPCHRWHPASLDQAPVGTRGASPWSSAACGAKAVANTSAEPKVACTIGTKAAGDLGVLSPIPRDTRMVFIAAPIRF